MGGVAKHAEKPCPKKTNRVTLEVIQEPLPLKPAFYWKRKNLGHSIQKIFSKFGHSSQFRVFSLENIENLVLNVRPGSVC